MGDTFDLIIFLEFTKMKSIRKDTTDRCTYPLAVTLKIHGVTQKMSNSPLMYRHVLLLLFQLFPLCN